MDPSSPRQPEPAPPKKRVLWLHTQPEHYHNRLIDDLARGTPYLVPGMHDEHSAEFEYVAAFARRGPALYKDYPAPSAAKTIMLRPITRKEPRRPYLYEKYHIDWRADLKPFNYDFVIVSGYLSRTQRQVVAECNRRNIPVAMWSDSNLRGDRSHTLKSRIKRAIKRRVLTGIARSVDVLLTANRAGIAYWRYYGGPGVKRKIILSPCYSDYAQIDDARRRDRASVLAQAGLSPQDRYIYSSARLASEKGLDLSIRAFIFGDFGSRGWKYLIAGTGPLETELKLLAGPALGKSVFLLGFQQPAVNLSLMAHAHLMALPSRREPHGIVVGEALAAGVPCLVSDVVGAARGLIKHDYNGIIFRSEDVTDLAKKLAILDNPVALEALRAAARPSFDLWYRQTSPIIVIPRTIRRLLSGREVAP